MIRGSLSTVAVAASLVLAACGSSGDTDAATPTLPTETPATEQATTSSALQATTPGDSAATTTTSVEPSTTAAPASTTCPTPELPEGTRYDPVLADVNGDNELDEAFAYQLAGSWAVLVEYGGGGHSLLELIDSDPVSAASVIGPVDFDGDGHQELAVSVGGGAYTTQVGFVRARDCELLRLAFDTDAPATFLSGASLGNFSGMLCAAGLVEQYEFTLDADAAELSYEGGFTPYLLEGDTFVQGFGDGTVLTASELESIRTFDCFGLEL